MRVNIYFMLYKWTFITRKYRAFDYLFNYIYRQWSKNIHINLLWIPSFPLETISSSHVQQSNESIIHCDDNRVDYDCCWPHNLALFLLQVFCFTFLATMRLILVLCVLACVNAFQSKNIKWHLNILNKKSSMSS